MVSWGPTNAQALLCGILASWAWGVLNSRGKSIEPVQRSWRQQPVRVVNQGPIPGLGLGWRFLLHRLWRYCLRPSDGPLDFLFLLLCKLDRCHREILASHWTSYSSSYASWTAAIERSWLPYCWDAQERDSSDTSRWRVC